MICFYGSFSPSVVLYNVTPIVNVKKIDYQLIYDQEQISAETESLITFENCKGSSYNKFIGNLLVLIQDLRLDLTIEFISQYLAA